MEGTPPPPPSPGASLVAPDDVDARPMTKWPKVFGIISLLYAIGGLLCQTGINGGLLLSEQLSKLGGFELQVPLILKVVSGTTALIMWILGVMLLVGAIKLLRRRPGGVSLHKAWAVARLVVLLIGTLVGIALMPASLELSRAGQEFGNQKAREGGRPDLVREFDEEKAWRQSMISTAVFAGVFAVYPLVVGFYMSRRKIEEEIRSWD